MRVRKCAREACAVRARVIGAVLFPKVLPLGCSVCMYARCTRVLTFAEYDFTVFMRK